MFVDPALLHPEQGLRADHRTEPCESQELSIRWYLLG